MPDCHFRLLQRYLNKCMWSICGPHLTIMRETAPECVKCNSSVQSIVWSQSYCFSNLLNIKFAKSWWELKLGGFSSWLCCNLRGYRFRVILKTLQTLLNDTLVYHETSGALDSPMCRKCQHELRCLLHCRGNRYSSCTWLQRTCSFKFLHHFVQCRRCYWSFTISHILHEAICSQWHFPNSYNTV